MDIILYLSLVSHHWANNTQCGTLYWRDNGSRSGKTFTVDRITDWWQTRRREEERNTGMVILEHKKTSITWHHRPTPNTLQYIKLRIVQYTIVQYNTLQYIKLRYSIEAPNKYLYCTTLFCTVLYKKRRLKEENEKICLQRKDKQTKNERFKNWSPLYSSMDPLRIHEGVGQLTYVTIIWTNLHWAWLSRNSTEYIFHYCFVKKNNSYVDLVKSCP